MVISIVILALVFLGAALVGTDGKTRVLDDYCRTECWSWKIRKLNECC